MSGDGHSNRFGLKPEVLDFIIDQARANEMDEIMIFGSRANGTYSSKSDIDLAIRGTSKHDFIQAMEEECPTLLEFDFIDLSNPISDSLRKRIESEGIRIYG